MNKNFMKKILIGVLFAFVLTACGGGKKESSDEKNWIRIKK